MSHASGTGNPRDTLYPMNQEQLGLVWRALVVVGVALMAWVWAEDWNRPYADVFAIGAGLLTAGLLIAHHLFRQGE